MRLDYKHPLNKGVLGHLIADRTRLRSTAVPIIVPDQHPDPYMRAGSHPDIVERVWDRLGSSLPVDCRALVYGSPALVHPMEGVVFALAYGTEYAIRIPNDALARAMDLGCATKRTWTGGGEMRIQEEMGMNWLFGCWADEEKQWIARTYEECSLPT